MKCEQCDGLMTKERLYDLLENDGQVYVGGWNWVLRCNACGNVAKWVIYQNGQIVNIAVSAAS